MPLNTLASTSKSPANKKLADESSSSEVEKLTEQRPTAPTNLTHVEPGTVVLSSLEML